jgi:hypothetical protein
VRASSVVGIVVAVIVFAGGAATTAVGVMRMAAHRASSAPIVYEPAAHPKVDWRGTVSGAEQADDGEEESVDATNEPKLPTVARDVPIFQARLLDGCSKTDLDRVSKSIDDAINVGAPLYNDGDFAGCYGTYESAARTIERDVGKTCKGPANALKDGRDRAKKRKTSAESAWAMRDAFDGILDVIERRGPEL